MADVPRRPPQTQAERIRTVVTTHASLSGEGSTAAARPVTEGRRVAQVVPAPTGGSQQLSFVRFIDDGSGAPITYGSAGNRPSILDNSGGPDVSFATYNGTFGITIQGSGIFQVQVDSTVDSLDPGDAVRIEAIINNPYPADAPVGYGVANDTGGGAGSGRAFLTACSLPFVAAVFGTTVEVAVDYVTGAAVAPLIDYVGITITQLSLA